MLETSICQVCVFLIVKSQALDLSKLGRGSVSAHEVLAALLHAQTLSVYVGALSKA